MDGGDLEDLQPSLSLCLSMPLYVSVYRSISNRTSIEGIERKSDTNRAHIKEIETNREDKHTTNCVIDEEDSTESEAANESNEANGNEGDESYKGKANGSQRRTLDTESTPAHIMH
ncbi:hypothetical protein WR25_18735 [Diploscapter pachys]|uniref:Uncharacterized protein n=1 Tax=Diploscapter pachys TaxID=2018661 RepID=A0A2A2K445_9BILA|nr:hypothetical protein WR25_18735 [Diploscapter pachys]